MMTALYRNDRPGRHASSCYAEGLQEAPERPALAGDLRADVAILGAGYTGLWAALRLARAGRRVVVLDAHRVGFGASGRNGGQVHSGFNASMRSLEQTLGPTRARAMWDLSERAKAEVRAFCATDAPEAAFRPGVADGVYSATGFAELQAEVAHLSDTYGATAACLDEDAFRDLVKSPLYRGGVLDRSAGHLDPMAYAVALARAAEAAGAQIFELSEVTDIIDGPTPALVTAGGRVTADYLVIAGNGYLPNIAPKVNARVMPINSFIAATAPLPDRWQDVLAEDIAVADSRFVVNYYRFTPDRRFLFGGRESYSIGFPRDISTALVARMEALFPQLKGVEVTHVWGGSLGITMPRLPYVARVAPKVLAAAGFSGHGVALSGMAGQIMAEAIMGQDEGLTHFEALNIPRFPGGTALRAPLLTLAMTWYALRDRLGA